MFYLLYVECSLQTLFCGHNGSTTSKYFSNNLWTLFHLNRPCEGYCPAIQSGTRRELQLNHGGHCHCGIDLRNNHHYMGPSDHMHCPITKKDIDR